MKSSIKAAAAFCLLTAGIASAQTVQSTTPSRAVSPAASSAAAGSAQTPASTLPMTQTPTGNAAVNTTSSAHATQAPVAGANSFTESEARARITNHGFANVTDLKKDAQGIWHGSAQKDGKPVTVALDFEGNVVAR